MGSEASAGEVALLCSKIPFQSDGELVLPPHDEGGVGLVLVDVSNGFCTVGAGNLVSILLLKLLCSWQVKCALWDCGLICFMEGDRTERAGIVNFGFYRYIFLAVHLCHLKFPIPLM